MCCSVLQCVAVCCSVLATTGIIIDSILLGRTIVQVKVLQCVAVFCRVLQCVAVCCRVLPTDNTWPMLQSVAVCGSMLQCGYNPKLGVGVQLRASSICGGIPLLT